MNYKMQWFQPLVTILLNGVSGWLHMLRGHLTSETTSTKARQGALSIRDEIIKSPSVGLSHHLGCFIFVV